MKQSTAPKIENKQYMYDLLSNKIVRLGILLGEK